VSANSPNAVDASPDEERDTTVVRPATTFMATQVMTAAVPRVDIETDPDATVIRPTLQRARDADRTLSPGAAPKPLPRQSLALPKGLMLHEYRIERVLGQGGFGITYLATDINLDAKVAIKEYLPEEIAFRASDRSVLPNASQHRDRYRQGLENFLVEARTLASFRHPNIVRVARFFEAHDTAYMVLEYERGRSLKKWWLAQGEHGERRLVERLQPLLDGLAVVHAAGYLHRDIKPDNIQVRSEDGRFVLLDFGSAGQTVALADQDAVVVTPGYAPIEQYGVGEQGAWTDLYALGATLYWVVAGRKPPDAEARAGGAPLTPAVEVGRGRFAPPLLAAIDWALQMDPAARPRSVDQWRDRWLAEHLSALGVKGGRQASTFAAAAQPERSRGEKLRRFVRRLFVPPAWPLRVKAAALALLASALMPALIWGAFQLSGLREEMQSVQLQQLQALSQAAAGRVGQLIDGQLRLARGIAGDPDVVRWAAQPDDATAAALRPRLAALQRAQPALQLVALADPAGLVRLSHGPAPDAALSAALPAQARALAAGRAVVAPLAGGGAFVTEPVNNGGGGVVGAVVLQLAEGAIAQALAEALRGEAPLQAMLVDAAGTVLVHPRADARDRRLDDPALAAAMSGAHQPGQLRFRSPGAGGGEQDAAWAPVPGARWQVALTAPRGGVDKRIDTLWAQLWPAVALGALVFALFALRFARGIVKAVERLAAGAHALRALDFDRAEVEMKRRDEIGLLARAFNGMVDVMRQRERERERTSGRR